MPKHKKKQGGKSIAFVVLGLIILSLLVVWLLQGKDVVLFNPKGLIAQDQHKLMMFALALMFELGIPTLLVFYFFAWKYRESNQVATYDSRPHHNRFLIFCIWTVPITYMVLLASVMWPATHRLAPQKAIARDGKAMTIQVVALRWKWLFIYPEQHIASVNFVQIPTDTPIQFELTADEAPMNSFWIPHLGGQLYAMTGHQNRLNLIADEAGDFTGSAAEINGAGFAGMKFTARAGSLEEFDQWVKQVKQAPTMLYSAEYNKLLEPSEDHQVAYYSRTQADLYDTILLKYEGSHNHYTGIE